MVIRHKHYHEHSGGGGGMLFGIAAVGLLFVGVISAYITLLAPLTDLLVWVCLIGYPVLAYACSNSIAVAVRRTLLAWCWFMISAVVAALPLLFLVGLLLETNPTQETNVLSVAICFAGIIGMGFYTFLWILDNRKT
jgi:hypothetical protein